MKTDDPVNVKCKKSQKMHRITKHNLNTAGVFRSFITGLTNKLLSKLQVERKKDWDIVFVSTYIGDYLTHKT